MFLINIGVCILKNTNKPLCFFNFFSEKEKFKKIDQKRNLENPIHFF